MREKLTKKGFVIILPDHEEIKNDYFKHFKETVLEQYGLTIFDEQYRKLSNSFNPMFTISHAYVFGYAMFKRIKIWGIYNNAYNVFTCAVPSNVENDFTELMRYIIRPEDYQTAVYIYNQYQKEKSWVKKEFINKKEMALYYQKETKFSKLHILAYVRKETRNSIINVIMNLLANAKK